jgi:hypothetical protein
MSCNNVQILNFNHNIVEVGPDNKIVITDQVKCNSITIPQPVTNILQINSPGPQGPPGPSGSGGGGGAGVSYITGSGPLSLTEIEVADYSNDVAVTFVNNRLKFVFGTPTVPSTPTMSFGLGGNAFEQDRFNKVLDAYVITGSFAVNGYTLVSASLYTGSTLLAQIGTGTLLTSSLTTSGSQAYRLEVTASSPLDGTFVTQSVTLTGALSKISPTAPSISSTPDVQLGASSNQIEQGATGSITFSSAYGTSNGYTQVSLVNSPTTSPIFVTGSATGSTSITIAATASYTSPGTDNVPTLTPSVSSSVTYNKIRSVRYGASPSSSFTQAELENLALWNGNIGTIDKGTVNPSGQPISITWIDNKYQYVVIDTNYSLTAINAPGIGNVLDNSGSSGSFSSTPTIVGPYKIYRTNAKQAGGGGTTQPYTLQ